MTSPTYTPHTLYTLSAPMRATLDKTVNLVVGALEAPDLAKYEKLQSALRQTRGDVVITVELEGSDDAALHELLAKAAGIVGKMIEQEMTRPDDEYVIALGELVAHVKAECSPPKRRVAHPFTLSASAVDTDGNGKGEAA